MKAAAAVPHLQWSMAEGCFATSGPDYEAFVTTRYDGQWVAVVIGSRSRESYLGGPWVARHAAQSWTERALESGGMPADAIDIKAEAARSEARKAAKVAGCPAWCTVDHEHDAPDDLFHMSDDRAVPCAVTTKEDGHICGRTHCLMAPEYNEPACDDPVHAQLVADNDGTRIEIGHGDDRMPDLSLEAALELAESITELAKLAGAS